MQVHATYLHTRKGRKSNNHMSKMNSALYEINHLSTLASKDQWMNKIHPLVKLVITIVYIATVVSINKYNLSGILVMGAYPIAVFILGELSFIESLKKVRIILPFVCIVGIFNPFFDRSVLFIMGNMPVTTGMVSMLTLMIKGVLSVLASYLLIATTTIEKICHALRLLRIPQIITTQILLTYRYITVLLQEANSIMQAYSLRAPNQKGVHYKVWGPLAGQLLLRSIDKANVVYESMTIRGYKGEFYYPNMKKCQAKDYLYLIIWLIIFALLKFGPILIMITGSK